RSAKACTFASTPGRIGLSHTSEHGCVVLRWLDLGRCSILEALVECFTVSNHRFCRHRIGRKHGTVGSVSQPTSSRRPWNPAVSGTATTGAAVRGDYRAGWGGETIGLR
ncbi:unnamed protein product, partial [Ectocarpus fasciculatus]